MKYMYAMFLTFTLFSGLALTPVIQAWTPKGRINHITVWADNQMLIFGGERLYRFGGGGIYLTDGGIFNPVNNQWQEIPENPPAALNNAAAAVWTGQELLLWGGTNQEIQAKVSSYDLQTKTWHNNEAPLELLPVDTPSAIWTGDKVLVWGGKHCKKLADSYCEYIYPAQGGIYDPANHSWQLLSTDNAPEGRAFPGSVWTGQELIIWGGIRLQHYSEREPPTYFPAKGASYNIATNSWTELPESNLVKPRGWHTTLWAGDAMIIWGGMTQVTFNNNESEYIALADGALYNPQTKIWQPISSKNAPQARFRHVAVWTGSKMIVWGGQGKNETLGDGGIYDLATDTWSSIAIENAPQPLSGHRAVWTGKEMFVWGGYYRDDGENIQSADIYSYDPVVDKWTTIKAE